MNSAVFKTWISCLYTWMFKGVTLIKGFSNTAADRSAFSTSHLERLKKRSPQSRLVLPGKPEDDDCRDPFCDVFRHLE